MSILLTDDEVSIILHENTFLTDGDFARAIQIALVEKIRKEPVYVLEGFQLKPQRNTIIAEGAGLYILPTAQELES